MAWQGPSGSAGREPPVPHPAPSRSASLDATAGAAGPVAAGATAAGTIASTGPAGRGATAIVTVAAALSAGRAFPAAAGEGGRRRDAQPSSPQSTHSTTACVTATHRYRARPRASRSRCASASAAASRDAATSARSPATRPSDTVS